MAIQFVNNLDINQNYLEQVGIENVGSDPASGVLGQIIFQTSAGVLKVCTTAGNPTGAVWSEVGGGVETVDTTDGTYINLTPNSPTSGAVTVTADLSAVDGTAASGERYLTKTNKWATIASIPGTYTFEVEGDGGVARQVNSNDTLELLGGTYITTASTASPGVTFNHDLTNRSDTTSSTSPGYAGTFTAIDSVTTNTTGHVTAVNLKTVTMPSAESYSWNLGGDTGTPQTIASGDTATFVGGTNINTVVNSPAGDNLTINLDPSVTLSGTLTVQSSAAAAVDITGKAQSAATTGSDPDATLTTKGYVDGLVSGGLTFKGTFRADSGLILSGDNNGSYIYNCPGGAGTRVAVAVGDYYVVATAGGSFYCSGDTLDIGDSIIGVDAAAADSSTSSDWSIVQSDEGVVSFTNSNGTYVSFGTVNTNATGAVTVGDVDLSAVDGSSTTSSRFLTKDNTWAVPSYTAAGEEYDLNATQDGNNVDLNLTSTSGTDNSVVQLTAGSNITLTRNSASEVTIASTDTGALGKRIVLNSALAYVSVADSGGIRTFTVDVSNASVFGSGAVALDVKCEVITAAGQTVYADTTRSSANLSVAFTGTPADSAYEVLLTYVG